MTGRRDPSVITNRLEDPETDQMSYEIGIEERKAIKSDHRSAATFQKDADSHLGLGFLSRKSHRVLYNRFGLAETKEFSRAIAHV